MMNNISVKTDLEIKWKKGAPIEIVENSQEILNYYAGKLDEEKERKGVIEELIRHFYPADLALYSALLHSIETWKVYWYFSPLHRSAPGILNHLAPINFPHLTKIVIN